MPPAQPPYAIPAKRLDCHVPSHHRFLGPFVERLRNPTTSSRPTVNVPFSLNRYGDSPFFQFARIDSSPRSPAFRSRHIQTIHRRKRPLDVTFPMQLQCITEQETGTQQIGPCTPHVRGGQSRCPALTNGYSGISTSFQPSR